MASNFNVAKVIGLPIQLPKTQSDFIQMERLKTSEQWMTATQEGKVGYIVVMSNEEPLTRRFGEDHFDLILSACKDLPMHAPPINLNVKQQIFSHAFGMLI